MTGWIAFGVVVVAFVARDLIEWHRNRPRWPKGTGL